MWEKWPRIILKKEKIDSQNNYFRKNIYLLFHEILNHLLVWRFVTFKTFQIPPLILSNLFHQSWPTRSPLCQNLVSKLVSRFCWINLCLDKSPPLLLENIYLVIRIRCNTTETKNQSSRRKKIPWNGEYFNVSTPDKVAEMKRKIQYLYKI